MSALLSVFSFFKLFLPDIDDSEKENRFKKGYLNKYLATTSKTQQNNIIDRLKELDNFSGVGTKA